MSIHNLDDVLSEGLFLKGIENLFFKVKYITGLYPKFIFNLGKIHPNFIFNLPVGKIYIV